MSLPKMTFRPSAILPVPDFTSTPQPQSIDQVAEALTKHLSGSVLSVEKAHKGDPFVVVAAEHLFEVIGFLRDTAEFKCEHLQTISATDFLSKKVTEGDPPVEKVIPARMEVLYALWSYRHRHQILIKIHLDRDTPRVASICDHYRAANWYERECYDLLGVVFENHPDHQRILLPPDWVGHPLRRDYVFPQEYNGMKVPL